MSVASQIDNGIPRPVTKYIKWADEGFFTYYDKEKKENVKINLPIRFVVLDQLHTISGYSKEDDCGIYCNEVKYLKTQKMWCKTFGNFNKKIKSKELGTGLYEEIKDACKSAGGKYCASVYALMGEELVNFQFAGSGRIGFFEAGRADAYEVTSFNKVEVNKKVSFNQPFFKAVTPTENEWKLANDLYVQKLKPYIIDYLNRTQNVTDSEKIMKTEVQPGFEDDKKMSDGSFLEKEEANPFF